MTTDRHWVVSNYDFDPSEVVGCLDGTYEIFHQGDTGALPQKFHRDGVWRPTLHSGHNLSDYFEFIVENYNNLPHEVGFVKGNIFPRHTSKSVFAQRIQRRGFIPLFSDEGSFSLQKKLFMPIAQQISPGLYMEINNGWYNKSRAVGKYYKTLDDLFLYLFNRTAPKYNVFVPGACMIVPAGNISRWPRKIYEHLYEITTYNYFPVEAFHVERAMFVLFGAEKL